MYVVVIKAVRRLANLADMLFCSLSHKFNYTGQNIFRTRNHSSRMRTVGFCGSGGIYPPPRYLPPDIPLPWIIYPRDTLQPGYPTPDTYPRISYSQG